MCSAGQQEIVSRSDMDTPEKTTQIANPLSKFEDSPVFNYINSLSPIKPVKSIHLTQTFNSLNFTSLPSIFTSPHVNSHKETRFLQRNSDPSKPGFLSENGNKIGSNDGIVENFDSGLSMEEVSADPSNDSNFSIELPRALTYDCGSPGCDPTRCCDLETSCVSKTGDTSISVVSSVKEASENGSSESELHLRGRKEIEGCDWESLISDAADLLIFNYPQHEFSVEAKMQMFETGDFSQQHVSVEGQSGQQETSEMKEIDQLRDNLAADDANICATGESSQIVDDEPVSNLHRAMRRRCLDFETVARRKNLDNDSNSGSYMTLQSDEKVTPETMQMVNHKPINDSTRRILPGIGLHLNALAIASQESKLINSTASLHSQQTGQDSLSKSLTSASTERDMVSAEHGNSLEEDMPQMSPTLLSEEFNQGSPKKKRRKAENAGEGEGCKRCNCKKSKCLKLYCECFAAGVYCIEPCSCQDCFNKPIHEDTVLATRKQIESRNPLAFAPKVIRNTNSVPEYGDDSSKTPASARHKRGCNCKKSSCLKKYCECYQGGVGCSINCRCEGCKNTFGRKDGSTLMETVAAPGGGEETETQEKSEVNKDVHKTEILNNEELDPAATLPATPLRACRSLYQLPFSSKGKPPRTLLTIGSSSGFYTGGQKYGKPSILRPQPNSGKSLQLSEQDEVPEILRGQGSPVKGASPNSKRVSPPNSVLGSGSGSSPSRRSGRKLILQSIPSFPSLTPHH